MKNKFNEFLRQNGFKYHKETGDTAEYWLLKKRNSLGTFELCHYPALMNFAYTYAMGTRKNNEEAQITKQKFLKILRELQKL